ncbi:hypothetical protein INT45_003376 [Circinella minor]|uniref:snRNA-activating protein complex subunit 3 n=1 Tax=Circinella minor TaxID=1195481 RepID=A0A8H7SDE1_9FUNG|nr:hypothetical protein INT45_003376 [Circinella minor]
MSKIDVGEFRRSHIELIKQQQELEKKSVDLDALKSKVDPALFETHECLQNVSKFFDNPTLFELVKCHKQIEVNSWLRRRTRNEKDQIVTKKPQAKDVMPNRTLSEEDEQLLKEMEKQPLGGDSYINPVVPKRRKFVAESYAPGALHELYAGYRNKAQKTSSLSTPASPSTITTVATLDASITASEIPQQHLRGLSPESSLTRLQQQQQETSSLTHSSSSASSSITPPTTDSEHANRLARIMHPELALPGLQDDAVVEEEEEEEEEEEDFYDAMEGQASSLAENTPELNNPDIPTTYFTRMYAEMEDQIKKSQLHTINPVHSVNLIPRQRGPLNYAHFNREKIKRETIQSRKPVWQGRNKDNDKFVQQQSQFSIEYNDKGEEIPDIQNEVILKIAVYHPHKPDRRVREFDILGSQKLSELRDAIYCMNDFAACRDKKDGKEDGAVLNTIDKKMSASYLFIENVFYVDTRAEEAGLGAEPDYSEPIRQWVMENERFKQDKLNKYTRQIMQNVTFEDLNIRLNYPYQFLHQGDCQHVIMVHDIRMQSSQDPKRRSAYPYTTYNWQFTRYKCSMCSLYPAEFMTVNDILSGSSPCFFCQKCYGPFHFDKDGVQMFPYSVSDYLGI